MRDVQLASVAKSDAQRAAAAERMRRARARRKKGQRVVPFVVKDTEVEALVTPSVAGRPRFPPAGRLVSHRRRRYFEIVR